MVCSGGGTNGAGSNGVFSNSGAGDTIGSGSNVSGINCGVRHN